MILDSFLPTGVISTMVLGPPIWIKPFLTATNLFSFRIAKLRFRELFGRFTASMSSVNVVRLKASRAAGIATRAELFKGPEFFCSQNLLVKNIGHENGMS
jgi:hypothetical protein